MNKPTDLEISFAEALISLDEEEPGYCIMCYAVGHKPHKTDCPVVSAQEVLKQVKVHEKHLAIRSFILKYLGTTDVPHWTYGMISHVLEKGLDYD